MTQNGVTLEKRWFDNHHLLLLFILLPLKIQLSTSNKHSYQHLLYQWIVVTSFVKAASDASPGIFIEQLNLLRCLAIVWSYHLIDSTTIPLFKL